MSPPSEPHRDQPAVPAHETGKGQKQRPADIVHADVNPFFFGQRLHPFQHVLARIVDDVIGAAVARRLRLRGRPDRRNDPAAAQARDFDASQPNAACGAGNEHGFAGL